jgi:GNAT superfamily N-acetyltransferase
LADIEIRTAKREELSAIVTLYNLMWLGSKSPIDLKVGENVFDQMERRGQGMYVVDVDGRVVGAFMLLIKGREECIAENVVVHPKFQRQGIGKMMMSFVTEKCKEAGCRRLVVSSGEKRERESVRHFYESLGFKRRGYALVKHFD